MRRPLLLEDKKDLWEKGEGGWGELIWERSSVLHYYWFFIVIRNCLHRWKYCIFSQNLFSDASHVTEKMIRTFLLFNRFVLFFFLVIYNILPRILWKFQLIRSSSFFLKNPQSFNHFFTVNFMHYPLSDMRNNSSFFRHWVEGALCCVALFIESGKTMLSSHLYQIGKKATRN